MHILQYATKTDKTFALFAILHLEHRLELTPSCEIVDLWLNQTLFLKGWISEECSIVLRKKRETGGITTSIQVIQKKTHVLCITSTQNHKLIIH